MGSFSRLRYVIAANVNSLLEKAEDPEKLLRALIRDMEDASEDARLASADLLAEQTHLNRMKERFGSEIDEWTARAQKSVETNRDDLARTALKAKSEIEQALQSAIDESKSLDARITQLEFDMAKLKNKLVEEGKEMTTGDLLHKSLIDAAKRLAKLLYSEDERVALRAAKDILDRSGYSGVTRISRNVEVKVSSCQDAQGIRNALENCDLADFNDLDQDN